MGLLLLIVGAALFLGGKGSGGGEPGPGAPGNKLPKPSEVHTFESGPFTAELAMLGEKWGWWIWQTPTYESTDGDRDQALASGTAGTEAQATAAVQQWIGTYAADAGEQPMVRRGVRVTPDCAQIQVLEIDKWIAHAAPRVRQSGESSTGAELMADALLAAFPECEFDAQTMIRGKPWPDVEQRVDAMLDKFRDGQFASVEPPEEAIAARLLGMSAPARPGEAFLRDQGETRYLVVVEPHLGGWKAVVWDNPWREGLPVQQYEKDTQAKAKQLALAWIGAQ